MENKLDTLGSILLDLCKTKERVSILLGYFPAWKAAEMYHTYGLNPIDMIQKLKEHDLKMDWTAFRSEMLATGMKPCSVDAMTSEAKNMELFYS